MKRLFLDDVIKDRILETHFSDEEIIRLGYGMFNFTPPDHDYSLTLEDHQWWHLNRIPYVIRLNEINERRSMKPGTVFLDKDFLTRENRK